MKFGVRVLIALCTFILGVVVSAVTHVIPWRASTNVVTTGSHVVTKRFVFSEGTSFGRGCPSRIQSVSLCDLVQDSDGYDGRVVRVEGVYQQTRNIPSLTEDECGARVELSCTFNDEACTLIRRRALTEMGNSSQGVVRVSLIGRPYVKEDDGQRVNGIQILELRDVTPVPGAGNDIQQAP
jgi:hypothetical protein